MYAWLIRLAARPGAELWLAGISFAESSFFPLPPDPLLLVMALARPARAWRFSLICAAASIAGGMLGYVIGYALFDTLARPLIRLYHGEAAFERVGALYRDYGFWFIVASGAFHLNFGLFVLASTLTRGVRFFLVAAIVWRYGDGARLWIERRLTLVMGAGFAAFVLGFALLRLL